MTLSLPLQHVIRDMFPSLKYTVYAPPPLQYQVCAAPPPIPGVCPSPSNTRCVPLPLQYQVCAPPPPMPGVCPSPSSTRYVPPLQYQVCAPPPSIPGMFPSHSAKSHDNIIMSLPHMAMNNTDTLLRVTATSKQWSPILCTSPMKDCTGQSDGILN